MYFVVSIIRSYTHNSCSANFINDKTFEIHILKVFSDKMTPYCRDYNET